MSSTASVPPPASPVTEDLCVLRGEPFSGEHLAQHARSLAESLVLAPRQVKDRQFAARFEDNAAVLQAAYDEASAAAIQGEPLTADAEWLLDNYYVVEEQLREIREDLPQRYYWELPKLQSGRPRVYALAVELLVHTDSALDEETIVRFLQAFQEITPLSIGEVWAVPIMLRLALVENLRRLASHLLASRRCRQEARQLVAQVAQHEDFRWTWRRCLGVPRSCCTSCSNCRNWAAKERRGSSGWSGNWATGSTRFTTSPAMSTNRRPPTRCRSATSSPACG
jgi:cyclic beta-1,2-glucan synthetase